MADAGRGLRAWLALCALAAAGSVAAWALPAAWLDWQPALAWQQPWRWWTGAFVHWSPLHLVGNLAGCAVLAALGAAARLPPRAALAWALAWPLTQGGLLLQPALAHYGGLSGVLHAGVAVAAVQLLCAPPAAPHRLETAPRRWQAGPRPIGAAVLGGLVLKLLLERPWADALVQPAGWDIALAPLAHATGAVAGAACALLVAWTPWRPGPAAPAATLPPR